MGTRLGQALIHYLDTHVVVWLCEKKLERLTPTAIAAIEDSDLLVSPMVSLELQYLYELKKIVQPPQVLLGQLEAQIGLQICAHSFPSIVQNALHESWTRDPFDRIIVAHARAKSYSPLITADGRIQENYTRSVWN